MFYSANTPSSSHSKQIDFPNTPYLSLSQYPDVIQTMQNLKHALFDKISQANYVEGANGVNRVLQWVLSQNTPFNILSNPQLPGVNSSGQAQWAQYKGAIVNGPYLQNNLLGNGLVAGGYLWQDSPPTNTFLPTSINLPPGVILDGPPSTPQGYYHTDGMPLPPVLTPQDPSSQWAVKSGYWDYLKNNPWQEAQPIMLLNATDTPVVLHGHVEKDSGGSSSPPSSGPSNSPEPLPAPEPTPIPDSGPSGPDSGPAAPDNPTPSPAPVDARLLRELIYLTEMANMDSQVQQDLQSMPIEHFQSNFNSQFWQPWLPSVPIMQSPLQSLAHQFSQGTPLIHSMLGNLTPNVLPYSNPFHQVFPAQQQPVHYQGMPMNPVSNPIPQSFNSEQLFPTNPNDVPHHNDTSQNIDLQLSPPNFASVPNNSSLSFQKPHSPDPFPQTSSSKSNNQMLNNPTSKNTHQKRYNFPSNKNLPASAYPDVTQAVEKLRDKILKELGPLNKHLITRGLIYEEYLRNFFPHQAWDTKSLPDFPGTGQYAIYKGHIVPASYIANNLYGQVSAGLHMPLSEALKGGDIGALGGSLKYESGYDLKTLGYDIKTHFAHPNEHPFKWKDITFKDQPKDQWAIRSGYHDYNHGSPWLNNPFHYRVAK